MFSLVYVSAAVTWFSDRELRDLLAQCRLSNAQTGITGMLLYKDGNFMQALEGDERTVRALEARIAADRRHQGMVTLHSGHTAGRQFSEWTMGFFDLNAPAGDLPAGYTEFLDTPLREQAFLPAPQRCMDLMHVFRQMG
jgi:Sensors of blue-light using FAD